MEEVRGDPVRFRLADGTAAELADADPRLRHLVAAVAPSDSDPATGESLYGVLGGVAGRAQLVTDSAARLADLLEAASGERVAALDAAAGPNSPA